ncbi:DUF2975 domain-containing protein [Companilactobacillus mishanensis]|uniref:DUF2975 domain-containing protein n=1 Tax=Companilactobacillus mishanensis TaxID=2486008 RepID=A0A5P0ZGZ7_9LACO|nr:DUF2975 domain-containing protein [Companilactobacillus mishanensis]MQS52333.1 DUF2975 domain-containing protein [Companilactobacillus mishanensis]
MKKLTMFLRFSLLCLFVGLTFFCVYMFPSLITYLIQIEMNVALIILFGIGIYGSGIFSYGIILMAWRLLKQIDENEIFTVKTVSFFKWIKISGSTISIIYAVVIPSVIALTMNEGQTGPIVVDVFLIILGLSISVFANVLEHICLNVLNSDSKGAIKA